jgi:hypothetical protein
MTGTARAFAAGREAGDVVGEERGVDRLTANATHGWWSIRTKDVLSVRDLGELGAGHEQQLLVGLSFLDELVGFGCRRHR